MDNFSRLHSLMVSGAKTGLAVTLSEIKHPNDLVMLKSE
jgi:hypothetical protein